VKFGCMFMGVSFRDLAEVGQLLERSGFESLWMPEHLALPTEMPATYPYSDDSLPPIRPETPCYDPWSVLSFLACATERIRLATNVYILPLRHPLQTARSVVTVDRLSGGRVTLGIGVGWLRDEYEWLDLSFEDRGRRTDEIIPVLRRLWHEETIEHHGTDFDFGPLRFEPKPLQREIPLEVGGTSPAALRRAGRLGDGWIELGTTNIADLEDSIKTLDEHRRAAGREDVPFEVTASGPAVRSVEGLRQAAACGVTRTIVSPFATLADRTPRAIERWLEQYGNDVMAGF
jgi:probable F420-dependent oxidoreductase